MGDKEKAIRSAVERTEKFQAELLEQIRVGEEIMDRVAMRKPPEPGAIEGKKSNTPVTLTEILEASADMNYSLVEKLSWLIKRMDETF